MLMNRFRRSVGRHVETWFSGVQRGQQLQVGVQYPFNLRIATSILAVGGAEAGFERQEQHDLWISLLSKDFVIEEGFHRLVLPRKGGTKIIRTLVEPLHPGTCRLEIVIYLASKLEILQRLEVSVESTANLIMAARE